MPREPTPRVILTKVGPMHFIVGTEDNPHNPYYQDRSGRQYNVREALKMRFHFVASVIEKYYDELEVEAQCKKYGLDYRTDV